MAKAVTTKIKLRVERRHRLLLRDQEELAHDDRQADHEEIRPDREEARRVPRSQDQVSSTIACRERKGAVAAPFCVCDAADVKSAASNDEEVAGRERCHEEATRIAPKPAEPHGPRRCGGPEHPAGFSMERLPQPEFWKPTWPRLTCGRLPDRHDAIGSRAERNVQTFDKRRIVRQSRVNLNRYGLRVACSAPSAEQSESRANWNAFTPRRRPRGCGRRAWRDRAPGRRA